MIDSGTNITILVNIEQNQCFCFFPKRLEAHFNLSFLLFNLTYFRTFFSFLPSLPPTSIPLLPFSSFILSVFSLLFPPFFFPPWMFPESFYVKYIGTKGHTDPKTCPLPPCSRENLKLLDTHILPNMPKKAYLGNKNSKWKVRRTIVELLDGGTF